MLISSIKRIRMINRRSAFDRRIISRNHIRVNIREDNDLYDKMLLRDQQDK